VETEEMFGLVLFAGLIINAVLIEKIKAFQKSVSEIPDKLLSLITSQIFIISIITLSLIGLVFLIIRHRNLSLERERSEAERIKDNKIEERNIVKLSCKNINGMNSNELEILTQSLEEYNQDSRIQCKIIDTKKELKRVKIEEYQKTEEYKKIQLQEEIKELKKQHYQEQLRLQDYHDAVLEKLKAEDTIIYDIEKLNKKEIEVLEKEEYKKTNEYDPIESKNKTFLVKQILNHSPSHTFLVARIKQLLEKHISHNSIRTHDTKDADLTFEINYKIYALEIEKGSLLTKKKSLRNKVSLLNNKYGQNWYFIVTNRNLTKKYRKYGKVTSRMGVRKIIEKLVKN
jgi:hypothetical protein